MAAKKTEKTAVDSDVVIAKAKDFWTRNSKLISGVLVAVVLVIAGYFGYKEFIQKPKEQKSADAIFRAESYFRMDSLTLALNGDGQRPGFIRIADQYSGTDAGSLACFYAGACYVRLNDNQNAVKYLKKFSTDSKPMQVRAYKLLGDAYADLGNPKEALDYYKKAAHYFEDDQAASAEALFLAAYLSEKVLKNTKEAIDLYKELKEKFPYTMQGSQADNNLAQLGVYNVN